jgi:hypothetical protein
VVKFPILHFLPKYALVSPLIYYPTGEVRLASQLESLGRASHRVDSNPRIPSLVKPHRLLRESVFDLCVTESSPRVYRYFPGTETSYSGGVITYDPFSISKIGEALSLASPL